MITFHGCEKDLVGALGATFGVICEGHTNACYNVSKEDIQQDFLTSATACFCDGDRWEITMVLSALISFFRCNNAIPDLPMPAPPPTQNPPKTCYNCGYACTNIVRHYLPCFLHITPFQILRNPTRTASPTPSPAARWPSAATTPPWRVWPRSVEGRTSAAAPSSSIYKCELFSFRGHVYLNSLYFAHSMLFSRPGLQTLLSFIH